ncbi:asparagine synthase (glutamine-hydrolyzing) [Muricauda sp. NFXS6]|uniref:asparagine synthase (glutamine-hydrolyzing) n=1 Tax=Allomuricauda sp. NFXS6 TaxID=2819094 RepID=UPI0032E02687
MCGILGSINIGFGSEELQLIKHRGPDDEGLESIPIGPHMVTLGHKRLSIQDLSARGHQPMSDAADTSRIIFNGEIYNHHQLRQNVNVTFEGMSDTETIVNLFSQDGMDKLRVLNGIFAFAYLDIKERKLYLVRDPHGVKPLYYYFKNNRLVFSSELRPLVKITGSREVNKQALSCLLRLRYTPSPLTLINDINKVRPGEIIEFDLSTENIRMTKRTFLEKYKETEDISFNEAIERYEFYLEKAIKRQLLSDVDVGIMLSGGIDSALVGHYARKHSKKILKSFTIGFKGDQIENEIKEAKETADIIGLEHYSKKIDFNDFQNALNKIINIVEEPAATGSILPMYFLSEFISDHVSVVLTGQGADEPLAGYGKYKGELIYSKMPRFFDKGLVGMEKYLSSSKIKRGAKIFQEPESYNRFILSAEVFNPNDIDALTGLNYSHIPHNLLSSMGDFILPEKSNNVHKMMFLDQHMNLSDDLLMYTDKMTMHFSIEARVPMLDLELVNFINSLPLDYKLNLRSSKLIHKKLAKKVLPKKVVNRPKKGFMTPIDTWFRNEKNHFKDVLLEKNTPFSTHFDLKVVERLLDNYTESNGEYDKRHIFLLTSISAWLNDFLNAKLR